ncbi:MAG: TadA family conjugal transfer-associated ATPase [Lapillicoccus sp.]
MRGARGVGGDGLHPEQTAPVEVGWRPGDTEVDDLDGPVWQRIRHGIPPDRSSISAVARSGLATLGTGGVRAVDDALRSRLLGAGPLDGLITDEQVTDIAVNGDGSVWVDRGHGMERAEADVGDLAARRALAVRLAGLAGRRLDDTAPYVDGQLPSGVRLHAILPPLVGGGPHVTLRVPSRTRIQLSALGARGMFPVGWQAVLLALVRQKVAFVVTGGTGAGKTTLLAALLAEVGAHERIVVVEDVRELKIEHPHVVRLEARPANVEGVGEISLTTLLRQALRMRPDRLVVGEVRGAEVRELLAALNTGHEGGCGTLHANAAADVVPRFEALGALADMTPAAVHAQLATAVRVVLHVRRGAAGARRLDTVAVLRAGDGRPPHAVPALTWDGETPRALSGWPELAGLLAMPTSSGHGP